MSPLRVLLLALVACVACPSSLMQVGASSAPVVVASAPSSSMSLFSSLIFSTVGNTTAEIEAYIEERYASGSRVKLVRDAIPRWGQIPQFDASSTTYFEDLAIYCAIPGVAIFAVTLIMWVVFSFAQCCCCKPNPAGYTVRQIRVALFTAGFCSLVVIAFCVIGLLATEDFHTQLAGSNGIADSSLSVLSDVNSFFDRIDANINNVSTLATSLNSEVAANLASFTDLGTILPDLISNLTAFGAAIGAIDPITVAQQRPVDPSASPITIECSFCHTLEDTIDSLASSLDSSVTPVYSQIDQLKLDVQSEVVDAVATIQSAVADASSQVNDINDKVDSYTSDVDTAHDDIETWETRRRPVVLVIFLLPLVAVVLFWVASFGFRKEGWTKLLVHIAFFSGMIMWLMFAIHMPLSLLVADGCNYIDYSEINLSDRTSLSTTVAVPLTACLAKQNILDALNVSSELNFADAIVFPSVPDIDTLLNFTGLETMEAEVNGMDLSSFPEYDPNDKYTALQGLNNYTNVSPYYNYYTLANVSDVIVYTLYGSDADAVQTQQNIVLTDLAAETQINNTLAQARANLTQLVSQYNLLVNLTKIVLYTDVPRLEATIDPLIAAGQTALSDAYCSPIDDDYYEIKGTVCKDIIVSASNLMMASFFVGIFLFGMNFSAWFLMYRLQHPSTGQEFTADLYVGIASPISPTSTTNMHAGVVASEADTFTGPTSSPA